ncbi:MAG: peptidoglycan DD-metalloendopeptidase family protein [Arcobacter sp.]|nr:peptidoglycan DD-metalloendopeptidase family protein [Arcobacter sp.]
MSYINRKNNKTKKVIIYLILILLIGLGVFMAFSPMFEKNKPKISLNDEIFWNLKTPLEVELLDDYDIKSYEFIYHDTKRDVSLEVKKRDEKKGRVLLDIFPPKLEKKEKPNDVILEVNVYDSSKWNFFMGNALKKRIEVKVDTKKPIANVISNTYLLRQGGSAAVIVEVIDDNLKDLYISFNDEKRFELFPFYKKNFYMAIIAWPINIDEFKRVNLIALDKAGNKTETKVPVYIKNLKKKIDKIKISDKFINRIAKDVLTKSGYDLANTQVDNFILANETLRNENVKTIEDVVRKNMNIQKVDNFSLKVFKQLKRSKTFAKYGERRYYYYKGKKVNEAWHLGMDWASVKKDKIYTSNKGKVIFKDYLGLYGNTIIIDHNYGISSLYAHTSRSVINLDEEVKAGQLIANTGSTGAVFGDHLHFGILVQGIEVNPIEWLSRSWIKTNIVDVIKEAKKVIDKK